MRTNATLDRHKRPGTLALQGVLAFLLIFGALMGAAPKPVRAQVVTYPAPVQTFYVPYPEDQLLLGLRGITGTTTPTDPMTTYVSIAAIADGTIIFYDQWENGYEVDIGNPVDIYSASNLDGTQIWGDGDMTNGYPPGFTDDLIDTESIILLESTVDTATRQAVIDWDAQDKFAVTKNVAVTRTGWASGSGTLLAGSVEVYDTNLWGTDYRSPVGANIPDTTDYQVFEYTSLAIMAGEGGATISVDANADGDYTDANDVNNVTLAEGQSRFINGGVNVGAHVISDRIVQVDILTGDIGSNYESRDSALLPTSYWDSSYYTPVSTAVGTTGDARTTVWLYNPGTSALSVTYTYRNTSGVLTSSTLSVPGGTAGGSLKQILPAGGTGASFTATSDFYAFSTTDSASATYTNNQAWDWGFSLIPKSALSLQVLIGLGIGRDPTSATNPAENGNPVWFTTVGNPTTNATVYADCDADPNTGANVDANGNRYDVAYSLMELEQIKVYVDDSTTGGVAHAATSSGTTGTSAAQASSLTVAHTTGTGANRLMLVGVAIGEYTTPVGTVSSVTYGGTALTFVGSRTSAAGANGARSTTELWALANPASGTANVVVTLSTARTFVVGVSTFTGADISNGLTSALGTYASNAAATGTGPTVNVTTVAGQMVYDVVGETARCQSGCTPGDLTAGAGQTQRWQQESRWDQNTDTRNRGEGSTETATGTTTTMSWTTGTNQPWSISAVPIRPAVLPTRVWTCAAGDQTGMLLYTLDQDIRIAAAWGQDPLTATASAPGLDVGTGVPPTPLWGNGKNGTLYDDVDGDGVISPGDIMLYTISIENVSRAPVPDYVLTEAIPDYTTYVPGSTRLNGVTIPDSGTGGTPFPLDDPGYTFDEAIAVGGSATVTFRVEISPDIATGMEGNCEILNTGSGYSVGLDVPFRDRTPVYCADLGDLPDSYGTSLAEDGARHSKSDVWLGDNFDRELDGQPAASGSDSINDDDNQSTLPHNDDEDGIALGSTWLPGTNGGSLVVNVTGQTGVTYPLAFWIDWNNDGDFSDAGESYQATVSPGSNTITFNVPTATSGVTAVYTRFRIYPNGYLGGFLPTGFVAGGEVEDYQIPFNPTSVQMLSFTATGLVKAVLLQWETASEADNQGFYLYRAAEAEPDTRYLVNVEIIPSARPGAPEGFSYEYLDTAVEAGGRYLYWLKRVDLSDGATMSGPVGAQIYHVVYIPVVVRH